MNKLTAAIALSLALTLAARPATASPDFDGLGDGMLALFGGPCVNLAGLVPAVANTIYVGRGHRASGAWLAFGYLSAAANGAMGGFQLHLGAERDQGLITSLGIVSLSVAAVDLGVTIAASVLPARERPNLVVAPLVAGDAAGVALSWRL